MLTPLPRILIVDDEPSNIHVLRNALRDMGELFFATDGLSAVARAAECQPDLVLLDAQMPGMDGFAVCGELLRRPVARPAIIFVTAHSGPDHETRALDAGAVDFIAKPISLPVVRARVRTHLTLKQQADLLRDLARQETAGRLSAEQRFARTSAELDAISSVAAALVNANPRPLAVFERQGDGTHALRWANLPFTSLLHDRDVASLIPAYLAPDKVARCEIAVPADGSEHQVELLFTPVAEQLHALGLVMVAAQDRTAEWAQTHRRAERHRLEAVGRMAGRMAHEINNILQPIMSHASLARHAAQNGGAPDRHIADIQDAVRGGREIVRSVLGFAGGNAVVRQAKPLDLELEKALSLIVPSLPATVQVERDLAPNAGLVAVAPAELLQIIGNLVANAVDAMDGRGVLRIGLRQLPLGGAAIRAGLPAGSYVELSVEDDGRGMEPSTIERAFDPFFTTKPVDKGSGVGLSTVRSLVEAMGGAIQLHSRPGEGCSVVILLPIAKDV